MGIWKEKMSRKWEGGEVKKTMMKKKGRAGVGEIGKGCFFIFIFGTFSKASHLKKRFFLVWVQYYSYLHGFIKN